MCCKGEGTEEVSEHIYHLKHIFVAGVFRPKKENLGRLQPHKYFKYRSGLVAYGVAYCLGGVVITV